MHHGHHLSKSTYNFFHGIGNHWVMAVKQNYLQNGLLVCTHGNTRRIPHNALSFQQISNIVTFIQNYAEQHAILLPGCIPACNVMIYSCSHHLTVRRYMACKHIDIQHTLLKILFLQKVWQIYKNCCQARNAADLALQSVAYKTFCRLWTDLLPHIRVTKPRSDLC